jgi:hypothetical protein
MNQLSLNQLCEQGQVELIETRYLDSAATFARAEQIAWDAGDFDTLSRLYLPLQEARRQIRQRCGEGAIRMRCLATGPATPPEVSACTNIQQGFALAAGWADASASASVRDSFLKSKKYAEAFLGAVFPDEQGQPLIILLPSPIRLTPEPRPKAELISLLPPHSLFLTPDELPPDRDLGSADSFAQVMTLWERLHLPFLQIAETQTDPIQKMQAYRQTLQVDPACELAHQHLADTARGLARKLNNS